MKKAFAAVFISALLFTAGCTPADQASTGKTTNDSSSPVLSQQQSGSASVSAVDNTSDIGTIDISAPDNSTPITTQEITITPSSTQAMTTPTSDSTSTNTGDPQLAPPQKGDTVAIMDTDFGTIKFKLFTKQVPELSKNFMELAKAGKYDGTPFHRVVQDFMIQGGDFTNHDGTGGYSYKGPGQELPNEIDPSLHHLYGTVSMAKTSAPVSIGSQFFIVTNHEGTAFLDGSYSPIGQVYEGMDVAEKIQNLQVPGTEAPSQTVNVKKVTIQTL